MQSIKWSAHSRRATGRTRRSCHFIADAGHQLRTPLTVVQGFIAILRRGGIESAPDRDRILQTMNDQSRIMGALIDKLILLERWEGVQAAAAAAPIDVGTLVADLLSPIADAHPERHFDVSAQSGVLAAIDPTELGYVVTNLADNAVKYGEGDIDVRVSARRWDRRHRDRRSRPRNSLH